MTPAEQTYAQNTQTLEERDELVLGQLQEVQFIARRIHERLPQSVPFEDLVHAGIIGLLGAARKFDRSKNVQFKSYAQFRIRGAIIDSLRSLDHASRRTRTRGRKLDEATTHLSLRLGRKPTEDEIAVELGVSLAALRKLTRTLDSLETVSQQVPQGVDRTETHDLIESAPAAPEDSPFARYVRAEMQQYLAQAIRELSDREQQVVSLYYVEQLTMQEIATILDVRESRISQIHCAALGKLREFLEDKEIDGLRSFVAGA
jgi:RNA polymerase sigma factor for flagellar operon FliA